MANLIKSDHQAEVCVIDFTNGYDSSHRETYASQAAAEAAVVTALSAAGVTKVGGAALESAFASHELAACVDATSVNAVSGDLTFYSKSSSAVSVTV